MNIFSIFTILGTLAGPLVGFADPLDELPPGKVLEDGSVAGEKQVLAYLQKNEPLVYKKITEMSPAQMRKAFDDRFVWFQRVGNYRKRQKCSALQKIQAALSVPETSEVKCISDILKSVQK